MAIIAPIMARHQAAGGGVSRRRRDSAFDFDQIAIAFCPRRSRSQAARERRECVPALIFSALPSVQALGSFNSASRRPDLTARLVQSILLVNSRQLTNAISAFDSKGIVSE